MSTPADPYANWRARLENAALPKSQQRKISTYETEIDVGFYRKRITEKTPGGATRTIGWEPVAFWIEGDGDKRELYGLIGTRQLNAGQCEAEWLYCVQHPISEAVYRAVAERKEPWPDQHAIRMPELTPEQKATLRAEVAKAGEVVALVALEEEAQPITPAQDEYLKGITERAALPGVAGPASSDDPAQFIIAEIEALKGGVAQYANIESDTQAAQAQDLRSQLTAAAGRLDKHRESLVRPHLDAQQAINARFNPVIKATKGLSETLRDAMRAWERTKREAAAEALRRAEAERQRIEAANAEAARRAAEEGEPAPQETPAVVQAQSNAPPPSEQIKGATGRAANVKTVWLAVVDDQDAAYQAMKANPVIVEAIRKVAQARLDAGIDTPGVSKKEDVKIR